MSTNQLGIRQNNTIIPLTATTKETKWLSVTDPTHITLTGTGITTSAITRAVVKAYADSLGNWHLRFNMVLTKASGTGARTTARVTFASTYAVVFKNTAAFYQRIEANSDNYMTIARVTPNTGYFDMNHTSSDEGRYEINGDIELESEPTWAAANMEGVVAVDVFVPSAAAGIQGLVDNTSGNTGGTPILGKTDGAAVAAGYVGEVLSATTPGFVALYDDNNANEWADALTLAINKAGVWLITAGFGEAWSSVGGTADSNAFVGIGLTAGNNAPAGAQSGYTSIYSLYKRYPVQALEPYLLNTASNSHSVYIKFNRLNCTTVDGSLFVQAWIRATRIA